MIERYYKGDPARGEKPGFMMDDFGRQMSGNDRTRMRLQKTEGPGGSDAQGREMMKFSQKMADKYGLGPKAPKPPKPAKPQKK